MGRIRFFAIISILFCISCKNNEQKSTSLNSNDSIETKKNIVIKESSDTPDNKPEQLEKMDPLSAEQMEKLAPAELMGATRSQISTSTNMGTGMVSATYTIANNGDIELNIFDCGGAGGAGLYGMLYSAILNHDKDDETEYTKTIDYRSGKAIEQCDKSSGSCTLTWFVNPRFLVTIAGNNLAIIKQAGKSLDIRL